MAKILEITQKYEINIFDYTSATDCKSEKVVDITEDLHGVDNNIFQFVLIFSRTPTRRIVKVCRFSELETFEDVKSFFSIDKFQEQIDVISLSAEKFSERCEISALLLYELIRQHTPA